MGVYCQLIHVRMLRSDICCNGVKIHVETKYFLASKSLDDIVSFREIDFSLFVSVNGWKVVKDTENLLSFVSFGRIWFVGVVTTKKCYRIRSRYSKNKCQF